MALFWVVVLGLSVLLYVLLDGMDLGIGMLFGFTVQEERRRTMMKAVEPVWDGNETWLVVAGVVLWGAFPVVYATLFSALYLPVVLMLAGLIFRGVAFEFRNRARGSQWIWDIGFTGGSFVAAFTQGVMVGALVQGVGSAHWLTPFAILCGAGLCLGYCLLGASWWVRKSRDEIRDAAFLLIPRLSVALVAVLLAVFLYALAADLRVLSRWLERPYLFIFPAVGVIAGSLMSLSVRRRWSRLPFYMASLTFTAAFATFAVSFWPYMIPFSITIEQAAAPHASLAFMFWGEGIFVLPLMLAYTVISHRVFRGKIDLEQPQ